MKSEKFEEWFDVAFDRAVSSSSLTSDESKRASWKKVQAQIEQVNRKRKRKRRMQLSGIVAASFIAGAVFFSPSGVTKALSPIVKSVVDLGNGMIGIVIKNGDVPATVVTPKTEKPDTYVEQDNDDNNFSRLEWSKVQDSVSEPLNMDELKSKLSFSLPALTEIPAKYHFENYTLSSPSVNGKTYDKISLKYTDDEQHTLWIHLMNLKTYQSTITTVPKETEKFMLGGQEIFYSPGVYNKLLGTYQTQIIQISSDLPKDEMVTVYKSFMQIP
ncbi:MULTISPECIES: hypothetical protein [Paenibacillus]|uniref:DUF4367 domain-containing protein n=1 Tax=Paenibacillus albilobatus TaxID=2716884 RepID=A0A919XE10_9BACL|nr:MULTISPECIES: hypothetical protein [Paenibacillus]GIO29137.1 hypothetical protein J2TS6_02780 [Paenibacillus albilobatus]